jgi:uncharacterized membrane protein
MESAGIAISAAVTIFAIGLLVVSLVSYRKYHNSKLFFISLVFIVLLIKGVLLSVSIFYPTELKPVTSILYSPYSGLFDVAVLFLLFIGTLKR